MGKKRMVAQEFNTIDMKDGQPAESSVKNDSTATVLDKIEDASGGTVDIRADIKAKLEAFEKMEKAVSDLSKENEALKEKMAEYVEEIAKLRAAPAKEVVKEVPVADTKLAAEMKALREENDSYLMKISELTFENARLIASASEAAKTKPSSKQPQSAAAQPYANVYRNMAAANGYSSWN